MNKAEAKRVLCMRVAMYLESHGREIMGDDFNTVDWERFMIALGELIAEFHRRGRNPLSWRLKRDDEA